MPLQPINQLFPFKRLFRLLLGLAVGVQLIIITYNHFTGYYPVNDLGHFGIRLIYNSFLSLLSAFMVAYPNLFVIRHLNYRLPWSTANTIKRLIIQLSLTVIIAVVISTIITLTAYWISAYTNELNAVLIKNALIYAVVNLLLMIVLEARIYFFEYNQTRVKASMLEQELSQIKYEMLKQQINPHFMFNSLNVLSGLIESDSKKAQQFVDEFALIYRYVLETIEQPIVSLKEELAFIQSYFNLQQMRYGESLSLEIDVSSEFLSWLLPPLSLQVVLENAIKHNIINENKPLTISVATAEGTLVIKNKLQPRFSQSKSTGIGQSNVTKRYALIGQRVPRFIVKNNCYQVELPLLKPDDYARIDH
ncbi:sensor histidine kinase [Sunxiuqinia indica]|uniref:sensor histidine kinase n=1 Tax=Sunxiuqinia indica TaxID=2692584 RepID=UPI00135CBEF1|nr:sensor histidine kinase [Sunxiuqinia indica]